MGVSTEGYRRFRVSRPNGAPRGYVGLADILNDCDRATTNGLRRHMPQQGFWTGDIVENSVTMRSMISGMPLWRNRHAQRLGAGERIYAIGDIHGRLDLLRRLLGQIEHDILERGPAKTSIVILGDFIDRGPDTARIATIFGMQAARRDFVVLMGNHEAVLVDGLRGDRAALDLWIEHGGDATLRSFGATQDEIFPADMRSLLATVRRTIPRSLVGWLAKLPLMHRAGQYVFVHAGIRPGVAIGRQTKDDMLWIREAFIDSEVDHGAIVVHGHTVFDDGVSVKPNRIGVDTGAYRTGRLSAVGLQGDAQWILDTGIDYTV